MRPTLGNIVFPVQRLKRTYNGVMKIFIFKVSLWTDCFNKFHGIDTLDYLE